MRKFMGCRTASLLPIVLTIPFFAIQNKILHCLINGTQLAWLIDIQRKQIWVWEQSELPLIYSGTDKLPTLFNISDLTVEMVMAMTQ